MSAHGRSLAMPVGFAEYLEAKFDLDERSLNREVRAAFLEGLRGFPAVSCIDVGAGAGATFRRLLDARLESPLSVVALDRDPLLLEIAREDAARRLAALGREVGMEGGEVRAAGDPAISLALVATEFQDYRPPQAPNVVVAHAFLDIVPLGDALRLFAEWLEPGGLLYASLNYDGGTTLLPASEDESFEATILEHYDDSMERRRVDGRAIGGAYSGRRLYRMLPAHGFEILACGSSDWSLTPHMGGYRAGDATCLRALLDMIGGEAQRSGLFDAQRLERWRADRLACLRDCRLGLVAHQLDLLARRGA
jgi:SAM-dependent methyltransferase